MINPLMATLAGEELERTLKIMSSAHPHRMIGSAVQSESPTGPFRGTSHDRPIRPVPVRTARSMTIMVCASTALLVAFAYPRPEQGSAEAVTVARGDVGPAGPVADIAQIATEPGRSALALYCPPHPLIAPAAGQPRDVAALDTAVHPERSPAAPHACGSTTFARVETTSSPADTCWLGEPPAASAAASAVPQATTADIAAPPIPQLPSPADIVAPSTRVSIAAPSDSNVREIDIEPVAVPIATAALPAATDARPAATAPAAGEALPVAALSQTPKPVAQSGATAPVVAKQTLPVEDAAQPRKAPKATASTPPREITRATKATAAQRNVSAPDPQAAAPKPSHSWSAEFYSRLMN